MRRKPNWLSRPLTLCVQQTSCERVDNLGYVTSHTTSTTLVMLIAVPHGVGSEKMTEPGLCESSSSVLNAGSLDR